MQQEPTRPGNATPVPVATFRTIGRILLPIVLVATTTWAGLLVFFALVARLPM